jgi:hypothetical protein
MIIGVLITNGNNEHPCIKEDDGSCALCCPNFCNKDGFNFHEASVLHLHPDKSDFKCAVTTGIKSCQGLRCENCKDRDDCEDFKCIDCTEQNTGCLTCEHFNNFKSIKAEA